MSDADVTPLRVPPNGDGPTGKPRIKKLRLLGILMPLGALAIVSTVFGMMMAVASDLPSLTVAQQLRHARNSVLYDRNGKQLGILTSNENRILVRYPDIASSMKFAVIAIEDKRFFNNSGVDLRGIARAFVQDLVQQRSAQGGSTIAQQFVKNALQAQGQPDGLREAARGGAGLPPHAQVVQGGHPHQLPQLDLLRQRRLRGRVRGAHLLRQGPQPPRLRRHQRPPVREGAAALGVGAAGRDHRLAERVSTPSPTRSRPSTGATWCWRTCSRRAASRAASTPTRCSSRCGRASSTRRACARSRRTSPPGCASS